jgi:hypothetical protein
MTNDTQSFTFHVISNNFSLIMVSDVSDIHIFYPEIDANDYILRIFLAFGEKNGLSGFWVGWPKDKGVIEFRLNEESNEFNAEIYPGD